MQKKRLIRMGQALLCVPDEERHDGSLLFWLHDGMSGAIICLYVQTGDDNVIADIPNFAARIPQAD